MNVFQTYHDWSGNLQPGLPQTWGWTPTSKTTRCRNEKGVLQVSRRFRWRSDQVAQRPRRKRLQRGDKGRRDAFDPSHTKHFRERVAHILASFIHCWSHQRVRFTAVFSERGVLFFEVEIHSLIKTNGSPDQDSSSKPTPSGMTMASAVPHRRPAPRMETSCRLL